jgi:diguanylate cyclase (GGDEF)-like protein
MPTTDAALEELSNSPYAEEWRGSREHLQFSEVLEAEYRAAHLHRVRLRVRVWHSLNLVLAILFSADQVRRAGILNAISLAHCAAMLPCTAALAWLVWSAQYQRRFLPAARVLVPIFTALLGAFVALEIHAGHDEDLAALSVNLLGVFFFAGLLFRQALLACACMFVTFAFTAAAAHLAAAIFLKSMVVMAVTGGIAVIVYRDVEQSYRRSFLEGALIRELATRDSLSGLMNRRAFDDHLTRIWKHGLRERRCIGIILVDIDHFKRYNDDWGHNVGDVAIRSVAQVVHSFSRRPLDMAARYGGEEFVVLLYDLAAPHIQDIAERLRDAVENLKIDTDPGAQDSVTVSVGVSLVLPAFGRTPQAALHLADQALYEAKRAGRNRVIVRAPDADTHALILDTGAFNVPRRRSGA